MTERRIDPDELPADTPEQRIEKALKLAVAYGGIDGAHHKSWTIDQMVRALTGCPVVQETVEDWQKKQHVVRVQGESDEYKALVAAACNGEDGPNTYSWDTGSPP